MGSRACGRTRRRDRRGRNGIRYVLACQTADEHIDPVIALFVAFGAENVIRVFTTLVLGTYEKRMSDIFATIQSLAVLSTDVGVLNINRS